MEIISKFNLGDKVFTIRDNKAREKEWKAAVVDGKNIKPDTWYRLVDGKFVEDN